MQVKLKANADLFIRLIRSQLDKRELESNAAMALWFGVLSHSIRELFDSTRPRLQREAAQYFARGEHEYVCDHIGIAADWLYRMLKDHSSARVVSLLKGYENDSDNGRAKSSNANVRSQARARSVSV